MLQRKNQEEKTLGSKRRKHNESVERGRSFWTQDWERPRPFAQVPMVRIVPSIMDGPDPRRRTMMGGRVG
jgi:hypothetical protein